MAGIFDSGVAVWTLPVGVLLIFDGWIMSKGHISLSEHAGKHPVITGALLSYLVSHLLGGLFIPETVRRYDPLAALARIVKKNPECAACEDLIRL